MVDEGERRSQRCREREKRKKEEGPYGENEKVWCRITISSGHQVEGVWSGEIIGHARYR